MSIINFDLIKSPLNWIEVMLMVAIGAFAFHEVMLLYNPSQNCKCGNNSGLSKENA